MMKRVLAILTLATVLHLTSLGDAFASCSLVESQLLLKSDYVALIFGGTIADTTPIEVKREATWESVSVDVERVWKGNVAKRFVFFNRTSMAGDTGSIRPIPFQRGRRYVIFARRLSTLEKQEIGLSLEREAFGTGLCAGGSREYEDYERESVGLGPGRLPNAK